MKKINIIVSGLFLLTLVILSCEDQHEVSTPDFNVTPITVSAIAGEPVEFNVENAPNFLMFYSGEFGHEYQHRNRTNADGTVSMSFKNAQKWGLGDNATGTLSVWTSANYDGSSTVDAVNNANWVDISDRFNIATAYDFAWTESGNADITDLANGEPIYLAFKFYAEDHAGNGNRQPEWRVVDFNIEMAAEGAPGPLTVATTSSPGFNTVDVQGVVESWNTAKWYWDSGNGYWRFRGSPSDYANEDWLITNSINLTGVSPDSGVALKTYSIPLETFTHTYSQPGTYTITMVGNNTTAYGSEEYIQEFTIVVSE